jgi:predicted HTH transcriptional regulator
MIDPANGTIANVGCCAEILHYQRLPDDRMKLLALGQQRFRVLEYVREKPYRVGLVEWIDGQLPRAEVIGQALRKDMPIYPELAVRELVANALIHQDFSIDGTGPMVEIFNGRIEITNPGAPLIDVRRLLDHAPRSRNEALARFMRRIGICEERGSGVDKVVFETEFHQLPPPIWEQQGGAFRVTLFAPKALRGMDRQEKIHACYLHACLRYVNREPVNNTSLRERFGVEAGNAAIVSRQSIQNGTIKNKNAINGGTLR